ncbi:MAG: hypothetical protein ACKV2T_40585 [Kofleriaceae bacterium]
MRDTWRATWRDDDTWLAVADSYRDRLPLAAGERHTPRVIARSQGNVYPFAVLDGAAPLDPLLEEVIFGCLTNDVLGVGAATFNRDRHFCHRMG